MEELPERSEGGEPQPVVGAAAEGEATMEGSRRADMEELAERSEGGEPQPKARRADTEELAERSEGGEPQPAVGAAAEDAATIQRSRRADI